jgi:hypothetical protein
MYKHLLGEPVTPHDLNYIDRSLCENLYWLRSHKRVEVSTNDTYTTYYS